MVRCKETPSSCIRSVIPVYVRVRFQEGMRQHFDLGHFLRNRYKGFLSESYDRHEVGALASSAFRSHVAGQTGNHSY